MRYSTALMNRLTEHVLSGGQTALNDDDKRIMLRCKTAYSMLMEHYSERTALIHLRAFYGDDFSESTCRGDVQAAKALFGMPEEGDRQYVKGIIVNACLEALRKAQNDRDGKAVAALSAELRKITGIDKDNERPFDPLQLRNPVQRVIVFDPTKAGATRDPLLEEKVNKLLDVRRAAGQNIPDWKDVDYEVIPDERPEG